MPEIKHDILAMVDRLAPTVRRAFLQSVADIKGEAQQIAVISALNNGDIEGAIQLLNLRPELFGPLDDAIRAAYYQGGVEAMRALPRLPDPLSAGRLVARFDARNPRAEEWLTRFSSNLIVEITDAQVAMVRERLTANMIAGVSPRSAALDLVGRTNKLTGRREGGVIGLDSNRLAQADRAFAQLRSGDPGQMRAYLNRRMRDRRLDSVVRAAIRDGKPVSAADARRLTGRLTQRLLRDRGETIARTELLGALHAAQDEGLEQLIENGQITREQVTSEWDAANDSATRDSHRAMDGQIADDQGIFTTGAGYRMRHPGDRSLGAPAEEIIKCRCRKRTSIDHLAGLAV